MMRTSPRQRCWSVALGTLLVIMLALTISGRNSTPARAASTTPLPVLLYDLTGHWNAENGGDIELDLKQSGDTPGSTITGSGTTYVSDSDHTILNTFTITGTANSNDNANALTINVQYTNADGTRGGYYPNYPFNVSSDGNSTIYTGGGGGGWSRSPALADFSCSDSSGSSVFPRSDVTNTIIQRWNDGTLTTADQIKTLRDNPCVLTPSHWTIAQEDKSDDGGPGDKSTGKCSFKHAYELYNIKDYFGFNIAHVSMIKDFYYDGTKVTGRDCKSDPPNATYGGDSDGLYGFTTDYQGIYSGSEYNGYEQGGQAPHVSHAKVGLHSCTILKFTICTTYSPVLKMVANANGTYIFSVGTSQ